MGGKYCSRDQTLRNDKSINDLIVSFTVVEGAFLASSFAAVGLLLQAGGYSANLEKFPTNTEFSLERLCAF